MLTVGCPTFSGIEVALICPEDTVMTLTTLTLSGIPESDSLREGKATADGDAE
jgi:hypothetical protein